MYMNDNGNGNGNGSGNSSPVFSIGMGSLRAAAWLNERRLQNGDSVPRASILIERRYKDRDGNWASTNKFAISELLELAHFLPKVIDEAIRVERRGDEQ